MKKKMVLIKRMNVTTPAHKKLGKYNGNLCSKDGVQFVVCLAKCIPPSSISLPMIASECVFATREICNMSVSDKRFLLDYYYSTTIYQLHVRGNRVVLPGYIKEAVR